MCSPVCRPLEVPSPLALVGYIRAVLSRPETRSELETMATAVETDPVTLMDLDVEVLSEILSHLEARWRLAALQTCRTLALLTSELALETTYLVSTVAESVEAAQAELVPKLSSPPSVGVVFANSRLAQCKGAMTKLLRSLPPAMHAIGGEVDTLVGTRAVGEEAAAPAGGAEAASAEAQEAAAAQAAQEAAIYPNPSPSPDPNPLTPYALTLALTLTLAPTPTPTRTRRPPWRTRCRTSPCMPTRRHLAHDGPTPNPNAKPDPNASANPNPNANANPNPTPRPHPHPNPSPHPNPRRACARPGRARCARRKPASC
jgi:hypothetical protein